MQEPLRSPRLARGAEGVLEYLRSRMVTGKPLTRAAIYRMVEIGRIPVIRLGAKRSEFWVNCDDLDELFSAASQGTETEAA